MGPALGLTTAERTAAPRTARKNAILSLRHARIPTMSR
jgi:hypothetical protein